MAKRIAARKANPNRFVTSDVLQRVASSMLPFYRAIAGRRTYAEQWTKAVIEADLGRMQKLLRLVSPVASRQSIASNGIGYFVIFRVPKPIDQYTNGTTIEPGSVQFFFETRIHRAIACAVLPLYRALASNRLLASALARGIRRGDKAAVSAIVRGFVRTPALKSIEIQDAGIGLMFKYKSSKYIYRNWLFHEQE